ncbi:DUF1989 domain-containing protein [Dyella silvae]|uniref:DUF1989 domain-containing protein n=1 Tax=Dyella silvae TaxID=2994424 RepID=UPI0022643C6F|nr:DUF1989 domain-containing protein [Dyella silvae]
MHESGLTTLHAHSATTMHVAAGEQFHIQLLLAGLMAGLWAICERDFSEYLSVQHSRMHIGSTLLRNGDTMVSNRGRAVLTWIDGPALDTQTALGAACDDDRWSRHGHYQPGRCEDRFRDAVGYGIFGPAKAPCPLNLFARDDGDDQDTMDRLPAKPADTTIQLRAEIDLIVLVSAYPRNALSIGKGLPSRHTPAVPIQSLAHSDDRLSRSDKRSYLMPLPAPVKWGLRSTWRAR